MFYHQLLLVLILLRRSKNLLIRSKVFDFVNHEKFIYNVASDLRNINLWSTSGIYTGPLFFNMFVNDIFDLKLHGKIQLYADDAAFFVVSLIHAKLIIQIKTI